ncbi:hypothetical protein Axy10_032 [Achromobacter phage vB_AxyP_19-32_Axy10]|uniref:Metallopeptidase domain-containing protein n=1 Tax=Achromobacter phage vB_AxyP_19-32_Axy10 TaxID=2591041 RepID=A0A514CU01_9CAUD|nr:HNH endonuclease [Achromobacter phage vB_AxyP_19-32_Axy10]QDH83930.1 hypothetical protein Axy10_032 [Achromobacter phage vB_AxyP_19-32_Axy10]
MSSTLPDGIQRDLDKAKIRAFRGKTAAFLAPIMSMMRFEWDEKAGTASVNGVSMKWNPIWFMALSPATRETVLMHELWHVARMHMLRLGNRDPLWWNYACDIWINNMLEKEGYSFQGVENCWKNQQYAHNTEEEIYDAIYQPSNPPPTTGAFGDEGGDGDMDSESNDGTSEGQNQAAKNDVLNAVVRAMHQAKMSGQPGAMPGDQEHLITQFLKPVVPWKQLLRKFFTDMQDDDYSWRRPNRRHSDIYLPCRVQDDGRLKHLAYYLDVSGSISQHDVLRFNSEVKHVWDEFRPEKMSLIQFDTRIAHETSIKEGQEFNEVKVYGGGGTCLVPVREHIIEHKPTAAIIFTDLHVRPMQKLPFNIPVIWVVINNPHAEVPFGKVIDIK